MNSQVGFESENFLAVAAYKIFDCCIGVLGALLLVTGSIRLSVEEFLAVSTRFFGRWIVGVDLFPERALQKPLAAGRTGDLNLHWLSSRFVWARRLRT
jgi:hypothetical protein